MERYSRYYDLSEGQRGSLTEEQVNAYLHVELMERGVLFPKKPVLEMPPPEPRDVPKRQVWSTEKFSTVGFETQEHLEAFLRLKPLFIDKDWRTELSVARAVAVHEQKLIDVVPDLEFGAIKASVQTRKDILDRNTAATTKYNKDMDKVRQETADIWKDHAACRERNRLLDEVRETFEGYVKLTNGDRAMARTFLAKVYAEEQVAAALDQPMEDQPAPPPPAPRDIKTDVAEAEAADPDALPF
jgi:hypothetical protein